MWDNPTLCRRVKFIEKNIEKRLNFEIINWEKLFDRSTDH